MRDEDFMVIAAYAAVVLVLIYVVRLDDALQRKDSQINVLRARCDELLDRANEKAGAGAAEVP